MAILDSTPGLQVTVYRHGQELCEYKHHSAGVASKTVERYVEAQSDATFKIHYSFQPPFPGKRAVAVSISIDGRLMDEPIVRPHELFRTAGHISAGPVSSVRGKWTVQPYRFSALRIREGSTDEVSEELAKKLESVGVITCRFYFLKTTKRNRHAHAARREVEKLDEVGEKAVKGESLSHQAILGQRESTDARIEYFDAEYADNGEPFAIFKFYYRSLAALKDLHLVERTPDPFDALTDNDDALAQLNREQLQAIVRRMREREESRLRLKREGSASTISASPDAVREGVCDEDPGFWEVGCVDLRAERRRVEAREMEAREGEVIFLD